MADFDVYCGDCQTELNAYFREHRGNIRLYVDPCEVCGDEQYTRGRKDGEQEANNE